MKLSCLLLAVVAAASADQGFYQPQPVSQSAPSGPHHENNYNYLNLPAAKQSWLDRLFRSNRRQGIAGVLGGLGGLGPIAAIVAVVAVVAAVGGVAYVVSELNSSGRGLDTDEWEVDHSVWMDQLQNDFESSWSQD